MELLLYLRNNKDLPQNTDGTHERNVARGAFLFSRLVRLHFTTGPTKAIISRKHLLRFTFNPYRGYLAPLVTAFDAIYPFEVK
jgi:hypothetical protein